MRHIPGGWGGIRTPGGVAPTTVFKTVAIDRSATHPKLFLRRSFNLRFCSLGAPDGAAHHSFARGGADACHADSYARPSQSTALPPILNCFYAGLSTCGFVRLAHLTVLLTTRSRVAGLYFTLFFTKRNRKNYHANKKQYPRQQLTHGQSPTG